MQCSYILLLLLFYIEFYSLISHLEIERERENEKNMQML